MDALDFSQQSQFTQTQPQTQQTSQAPSQSSRFPPHLWGVLLSISRAPDSASFSSAVAPHSASAALPPPPAPGAAPLPRPERLDLSRSQSEYTIGRYPRCDLVLNGPKISSHHARIVWDQEGGVVRLEDKSTNGTFVRNHKVGRGNVTILESGDTIVFGPSSDAFEHEFRYVVQIDPSLSSPLAGADPYGLGELSQSQSATGDGRSIHASYEVREQIGKGSFATVRKGVRRSDGRIVAIKIIQRARFASNPKTMEMIEREVEIMKGLEHRFCVKCIDYFEDDQRIWLVLEYVDGGDLLDYVMKRRGLKESETREIALMVCEAVAYLHSKGITHRDLKPENLLLTRGAKPICKVTDFGLAKMVDDQTMLKTMCGTPTYLAPEVILNPTPLAGYGSLVDAWSIGVVLYSCLTNQTPFDESESTPLPQRMRERVVDLSVPRELGVSDVACDFLARLLVADPRGRMSCSEALQHPWLALKPSPNAPPAASPAAAALLASSLPFNDPLASPALDGDESVTRFHDEEGGSSRAGGMGEDSGVDSQGFGNLRINGTAASPAPAPYPSAAAPHAHPRPPPARPPVPPFALSPAHKRKEPMSAFSDSSISLEGQDSRGVVEMEVAEPAAAAHNGEEEVRPRPLGPEDEPLEPAAPSEPMTEEAFEDAPEAEEEHEHEEEPAAPAPARRTPARQPRSSGHGVNKVVVTPARAAAARGRARAAVKAEREAPQEEEERAGGEEPEVGGIAAAVKNRRRKAARLH
ncbi:hypothetical protein JCM10450v2_003168 [Rhodotorula kratochvilovae]